MEDFSSDTDDTGLSHLGPEDTGLLENIEDPGRAVLTNEQLRYLIYQKPSVRKAYTKYFGTTGKARKCIRYLLFERNEEDALVHPEIVISSNIRKWKDILSLYDNPDTYRQRSRIRQRAVKLTKAKQHHTSGQFQEMPLHEVQYIEDSAQSVLAMETCQT